jgi:hypothetical protein
MAGKISQKHAAGLRRLREQALRWRPGELGPDEGDEAFQQHKLLATGIQKITLLDRFKDSESETNAWVRYFVRCFPEDRNDGTDARLLFDDWRTSLIKNGAPGERVVICHGRQPNSHWVWDRHDRLSIDLESMWDDFGHSLGEFDRYLRENPDRCAIALDRFNRKGTFTVEELIPRDYGMLAGPTVVDSRSAEFSASASSSVTTIKLEDNEDGTFKL